MWTGSDSKGSQWRDNSSAPRGGFTQCGLGLSAKDGNGETTAVLPEEALLSVRALRLVTGGHLTDLALIQGHFRLLRVAVQSLVAKRPAVPLWALPGRPAVPL